MTPAETKAASLAAVFLTGLWVWMIWRWNEAESQAERDERIALKAKEGMRQSGRLRVSEGRSELLKKLRAIKRRGDQLTKVYNQRGAE